MLHAVQLPLGLILQGSSSMQGLQASTQQQQQQLSVGSRVLALAHGQQLWQQAEITSISEAAAAAVEHCAGEQQQQQGSHACTVLLVESGQSMILPFTAITLSSTAAVTAAELDTAAAAAAGTASVPDNDVSDDKDMSISSEEMDYAQVEGLSEDGGSSSSGFVSGSEQGDDSESESDDPESQGYARVGLGSGGVLEHAR
jgi:hypothetical protein